MKKAKTEYQRAVMVLNSCQYGAKFDDADRKSRKIDMMYNCLKRIDLKKTNLGRVVTTASKLIGGHQQQLPCLYQSALVRKTSQICGDGDYPLNPSFHMLPSNRHYKMDDVIEKLSIIHVAGTKGKGSTCEYVQNLLQLHGYKTGSFSTPHLIEVRERIRINGKPISEEIFCDAFWHVFGKILATRMSNDGLMPGYAGITLLMAFYIFLKQAVDVVVLEVGMGGEYDATNFIKTPAVCGIASLHLEHTAELGNTVEEIGWHKAGIMKKGVPLVTVPQQDSVMAVILNKANSRRCPVFIAPPINEEEVGGTLGIAGDAQKLNAGLALQLCRIFLEQESRKKQGQGDAHTVQDPCCQTPVTRPEDVPRRESTNLTPKEKEGLMKTKLSGRSQIVKRGNITYYLDGAHTTESMQQCVAWFKETASKEAEELGGKVHRSLVFRMKATKNALAHLPYLTDLGFQRAAFCPHIISTSAMEEFPDSMDLITAPEKPKETAASQLELWEKIQTNSASCSSRCFPSIASALWWAGLHKDTQPSQPPLRQMAEEDLRLESEKEEEAGQGLEKGGAKVTNVPVANDVTHVQVLVTGSLMMVGGALTIIKPDLWDY